MSTSQESIFSSALRSFFVSAFAIFGLITATIPLLFFFGAIVQSSGEYSQGSSHILLHDANGSREPLPPTSPVVLQLDIYGPIGEGKFNADSVRKQLFDSRSAPFNKDRVKALLLMINSPGGTVTDSDGIYRAIMNYKKKFNVPVYAYIDGLCASGGYYIAAAADKIYASDASLVGSVGTLMHFVNASQTLEKLGIEPKTLTGGKDKDAMSPWRPWSENEDQDFQRIVANSYDRFVDIVTHSRQEMDKELLISEYGAKIFSAADARDRGFLDGIGYEREGVLAKLVDQSSINDEKYQVVKIKDRHWLSDVLEAQAPILSGKIAHEFKWNEPFQAGSSNKLLYLFTP